MTSWHVDVRHLSLRTRVIPAFFNFICWKQVIRLAYSMSPFNIFEEWQIAHGSRCFRKHDLLSKLKNAIHKYVCANGFYKKVVKRIIVDAIEFHASCGKGTDLGIANYECASHPIIVLAANMCQRYDIIDDADLLRRIFMSILQCDRGFDRFFSFLDPLKIFPFEVDPILFPFQNLTAVSSITKEHLTVLEYFLAQATNIRVPVALSEFRLTGDGPAYVTYYAATPFVEMPIASSRSNTPLLLACHSISAAAVLLLLRHGADPLRPGQAHQIVGLNFQHPLYVIVTKLNASVFWRTHRDDGVRSQFTERHEAQDAELRLCLRYFCRALVRLPISIGSEMTTNLRHHLSFQLHPYHRAVLPDERSVSPAELTHQCRCVVRRRLRNTTSLSSAIGKLPLPTHIKRYLDLLYD